MNPLRLVETMSLESRANDGLRINWRHPARTPPVVQVVAWSLLGVNRFRRRIIESVLDSVGKVPEEA